MVKDRVFGKMYSVKTEAFDGVIVETSMSCEEAD